MFLVSVNVGLRRHSRARWCEVLARHADLGITPGHMAPEHRGSEWGVGELNLQEIMM